MDFDFSKATRFVIVVENRRHRAEFIEAADNGTISFKILERDHAYLGSHSGKEGCVFFTKDNRTYYFGGKISSPSADRVTVLRDTPVEMDRRVAVRMEVQAVPSQISEPGFFRPKKIDGYLLDISRGGAKIAPRTPLQKEKSYTFETNFPVRHSHLPFSASCTIRYCGMERGHLVSGVIFTEVPPESSRSLEHYLAELLPS